MVILDPATPGCPVYQIKVADQFKALFDPRRPMSEATGAAMAEWAKGQGDAQKQKEAMDLARDMARGGSAEFTTWWQSDDGKVVRGDVKPIMDEIKAICAAADDLANQSEDDPFSGPSDSQRGENHNLDVEALIASFHAAKDTAELQLLNRSNRDEISGLSDEDRERVNLAYDEAFSRLTSKATPQ
jgi:hypothetical protein